MCAYFIITKTDRILACFCGCVFLVAFFLRLSRSFVLSRSFSLSFSLSFVRFSLSLSLSRILSFFLSFTCCRCLCPDEKRKKAHHGEEKLTMKKCVLSLSVCHCWNIFSTVLVSLLPDAQKNPSQQLEHAVCALVVLRSLSLSLSPLPAVCFSLLPLLTCCRCSVLRDKKKILIVIVI